MTAQSPRRTVAKKPPSHRWDARKRECIQDAVIHLMSSEGIAAVTMDRVAQEVGIAKGTVYLHYRDKQALVDAAMDAAIEPLMERLHLVLSSDLPVADKLGAFVQRYVGYFDERRELFRVLLYEREVTRAQGSRYRSDRYRDLLAAVARAVAAGVESGDFNDCDATKTAAMLIESTIAIVHQRLMSGDTTPPESDAKMIVQLFVRGLAKRRRN